MAKNVRQPSRIVGTAYFSICALRAGPDRRRRIAAEDAAARIVEAHAVLRHLLERHAHREGVEPAAAVLLRRAERPEPRGLRSWPTRLLVVVVGRARARRGRCAARRE